MIIRPFFIPGIAHSSYLIGGVSSCFIIDPARNPEPYIVAAEEEGFRISGILETHLHADFISGHLDLHALTNAPIYAPKSAECKFEHTPVKEGSTITLDDCIITVLETPGHTPEHVSYTVTHMSRGDEPVALFPGDTLFVGDVGRPDLFPGHARELASELYSSLHEKILKLPDYCEVYPAHGAGSFCGRALSAKRSTTIGYERRYNTALQIPDRESFIRELTENMPPSPDHFRRCSDINRKGPVLLSELPKPKPFSPRLIEEKLSEDICVIVDTRKYDAFGSVHIPNSWNIDKDVNFSTFAGWVLPSDRDFVLVLHQQEDFEDIVTKFQRVGLDRIMGYIQGGMQAWASSGKKIGQIRTISVHELNEMIIGRNSIRILDVRTAAEYAGSHISGSVNIHWPDLRTYHTELQPNEPIAVMCATGSRSGIACSILKRNGFTDVMNVAGGYNAWMAAGFPDNY